MSSQSNRKRLSELTQTRSDTGMGDLLRRYWWPICGDGEIQPGVARPIRLLSTDLVLVKTLEGQLGLLDRHCSHRRANLANGIVEASGIRCSYHGWLFSFSGKCLARPFDDILGAGKSDRMNIGAYEVRALGGLIWAYLGPKPVPELPDWEFFSWKNGFVQIVISEIPCNWFQCQENSIDPVHFEWQHGNWSMRKSDPSAAYQSRHTRIAFEEFKYGFIYRRLREDTTLDHPLWKTGRVCLWPAALFTGNHIEYRVPIDDENTLSVTWSFSRVPTEREPYIQDAIPVWRAPVFDENGAVIASHLTNQDFMAWLGQGRIADRSSELLSASDKGIAMMRARFFAEIDALRHNSVPKGTVSACENRAIALPVAEREFLINGANLRAMIVDPDKLARLRGYIFQAGQPEQIRAMYEEAMGIAGITLPDEYGPVDILAMRPQA